MPLKAMPMVAFGRSNFFPLQSNAQNYERRMPVDIYSLRIADEMLGRQTEWPYPTWTTFISESRA